MPEKRTIIFKIPEVRPDELPASILADYIRDLSILFGRDDSVSLVSITENGTDLAFKMPSDAALIAHERLSSAANNEGTHDENKAFQSIDNRLRFYQHSALVIDDHKAKIIEFPGKLKEAISRFPAITQNGMVEGIPIRVGGPKENVPVHLQDGDIVHHCTAPREKAAEIAELGMFKAFIRVNGEARWNKGFDGEWYRTRFYIQGLDVLDDSESLVDTITKLRAVPGNGWRDITDPIAALNDIRRGGSD